MDDMFRFGEAKSGKAVDQDAASDPEHGRGADSGQNREELRHAVHETVADGGHRLAETFAADGVARHPQADVVSLDDQADHAIDGGRDGYANDRDRNGLGRQGGEEVVRVGRHGHAVADIGERDRHDFGGQNEVGADCALDLAVFECLGRQCGAAMNLVLMFMGRMRGNVLQELLGAFVAEVYATDHQEWSDQPRGEIVEREGRRKEQEDLVHERTLGDLPDHRQFALGRQTDHVLGGYGRVIDHDTGRLRAGLSRLSECVIDGGGGEFRDHHHVIQESHEAGSHFKSFQFEAGQDLSHRILVSNENVDNNSGVAHRPRNPYMCWEEHGGSIGQGI
ncbi:hypothetical protein D3C71_1138370 [compost metagenome]